MKATKADLSARSARLEKENTLLSYALAVAVQGDKPAATVRWREKDPPGSYRADLYYPNAPHGGFVIVTFRYPGQRDSHSVHYADEWARAERERGLALEWPALATAADEISRALRAAWQEKNELGRAFRDAWQEDAAP